MTTNELQNQLVSGAVYQIAIKENQSDAEFLLDTYAEESRLTMAVFSDGDGDEEDAGFYVFGSEEPIPVEEVVVLDCILSLEQTVRYTKNESVTLKNYGYFDKRGALDAPEQFNNYIVEMPTEMQQEVLNALIVGWNTAIKTLSTANLLRPFNQVSLESVTKTPDDQSDEKSLTALYIASSYTRNAHVASKLASSNLTSTPDYQLGILEISGEWPELMSFFSVVQYIGIPVYRTADDCRLQRNAMV